MFIIGLNIKGSCYFLLRDGAFGNDKGVGSIRMFRLKRDAVTHARTHHASATDDRVFVGNAKDYVAAPMAAALIITL